MDKNLIKSRWEEDYELIENEGLFEEYLEMGLYAVLLTWGMLWAYHCTIFALYIQTDMPEQTV